MNWSRRCLCFLGSHCYDSRYYSLPASKLFGSSEKILVKKRCPCSNVLILSCFMVVLLPVILYLVYIISSFSKIQTLKVDSEWSCIHCCCISIWFWNLTKFLLKGLRGWIVWFSFGFEFLCVGVCLSWTIVLIKTIFLNLSGFWNRFPQMAVENGRIFVDGVPVTSLLHLG